MAHAEKPLVEARVADLYKILLDGALWPVDVCEYVREKEGEAASPWFVPPGESPLSDSQIYRYAQKARKLVEASASITRKRLLKWHVAQRKHLFTKANLAGDTRTALACLDSEAKLMGLFEADLLDRIAELEGRLAKILDAKTPAGPGKAD